MYACDIYHMLYSIYIPKCAVHVADLDHTNDTLRSSIVDWMKWLQHDIGFEGWRFDFVKGYGAEFMQQYCGETVGNNAFNVGEYWADLKYDWSLHHVLSAQS